MLEWYLCHAPHMCSTLFTSELLLFLGPRFLVGCCSSAIIFVLLHLIMILINLLIWSDLLPMLLLNVVLCICPVTCTLSLL